MAGTIFVTSNQLWSSAGWLFDWVVRYIASTVRDEQLSAQLQEIVDVNLGMLVLEDFSQTDRHAILAALRSLPAAARTQLPSSLPGREEVLALLDSLVEMAACLG